MQHRYFVAASVVGLIGAVPAARAETIAAPAAETEITVLATGHSAPVDLSGQAITVVGAEELAQIQGADIARVLSRLPGVSVNRSGTFGGQTAVFVRGAQSEQLAVLVDGVKVEDISAPSGGYDFGGLMSGDIQKVELLRGSNSVVWGSNAIGGVLGITTRETNGLQGSVEYGSNGTWSAEGGAGIKRDRYAVSVNVGKVSSDGISTMSSVAGANPFRQLRLSGKARLNLAEGLKLSAQGRYVDGRLSIDSYTGYDPVTYASIYGNIGEYQINQQASGRAALEFTRRAFGLTLGGSVADQRRGYFYSGDAQPYQTYMGRTNRLDLTGYAVLPAGFRLDFGADTEWARARTYYYGPGLSAQTRLSSGHALLGWTQGRVALAAGVRVDDHSQFGIHTSFGANGSVTVLDGLRLRASYGEGFKAPTLYQLLSDYGNKALAPETSRSYDAGVEYGRRDGRVHGALTWFHRDTTNQIDFVSCSSLGLCASRPYGVYANTGRARAEGIEIEGGVRPTSALHLTATYTHLQSQNRTVGNANYGRDLARRPRDMLTLAGDVTVLSGFDLGADVRMVGDSFDNAANTVRLDSYVLVGLRAAWQMGHGIELYGRIENLTDARYTVVSGYNTPGRSATIGVRAKL
ncbi:TonB-dependent receptor [Novosphingobium sp. FSY-8]|uniref:TonB-dependent receptor n=1 Tax=Novosphingobium ovatum TaxID=1908523 RepID=A0ABW9X9T4_9SPHN|nr:TonB-dependent receptor [Novosphingobium ovatum]NBC35296.1 TonB-dependent receptor [Novosphingobium ovatum]